MHIIGPTFTLVIVGAIIVVLITFVVLQMTGKKMSRLHLNIAMPVKETPPRGEAAFEWYVRRSILSRNAFDIKEIHQMERVRSLYFNQDTYPLVKEFMSKAISIDSIRELPVETYKSDEDIEIVTFRDQDGQLFAATIYDSWELWQDPEMLDIFPLLQTV